MLRPAVPHRLTDLDARTETPNMLPGTTQLGMSSPFCTVRDMPTHAQSALAVQYPASPKS